MQYGFAAVSIDESSHDLVAKYHHSHENSVAYRDVRVTDLQIIEHIDAVEGPGDPKCEVSGQEEDRQSRKGRIPEGDEGVLVPVTRLGLSLVRNRHDPYVARDPQYCGKPEQGQKARILIISFEQVEVVSYSITRNDRTDQVGVCFTRDETRSDVLRNDVGEPAVVEWPVQEPEEQPGAKEDHDRQDATFRQEEWDENNRKSKQHLQGTGDHNEPLWFPESVEDRRRENLGEAGERGDRNEVGDFRFGRAEPQGAACEGSDAKADHAIPGSPKCAGDDEGVECARRLAIRKAGRGGIAVF